MRRLASTVAVLLGLSLLAGCPAKKALPPEDPPKTDTDKDKQPPDKDKKVDDKDKKAQDKDKKEEKPPPRVSIPIGAKRMTSVEFARAVKEEGGIPKIHQKKPIVLTGRVMRAGRLAGEPTLQLEGLTAEEDLLGTGVHCVFGKGIEPWKLALPGQTVRILGTVADDGSVPRVDGCYVDEVSGEEPSKFKAEELTAAYGAGVKGMKTLYGGKPLILEGDVLRVDEAKDAESGVVRVVVVLKTKPGPSAYVRFEPDGAEGKRAMKLKPRQHVKAIGTFSTDGLQGASVGISYAPAYDAFILEPRE